MRGIRRETGAARLTPAFNFRIGIPELMNR